MKGSTRRIIRTALDADPDLGTEQVQAALAVLDGKAPRGEVEAQLLTVAQTGALLSLSRQSLWRLASDGVLCPIKVRGSTRYRRRDIEAFVEGSAAT